MTDYQANPASVDILVVDDTRAHLRHLVEILTRKGYHVRPVLDGQSALIAVHAAPPELILLDLKMPNMDGLSLTHHHRLAGHGGIHPDGMDCRQYRDEISRGVVTATEFSLSVP